MIYNQLVCKDQIYILVDAELWSSSSLQTLELHTHRHTLQSFLQQMWNCFSVSGWSSSPSSLLSGEAQRLRNRKKVELEISKCREVSRVLAMVQPKQATNLMKYIPRPLRPATSDISSGALWGCTALVGAIWLVQPFGWMKEQIWPTPEEKK